MAQGYVIINTVNNMKYYGIVYRKNKTYLDRFHEHICGKGGKILFKEGILKFGKEKFTCELLIEGDLSVVKKWEDDITKNNLWPIGYNGNAGHVIINTPETRQKALKTRYLKYGDFCSRKLKGKTWDEIHGIERSKDLKERKKKFQTGKTMRDRIGDPTWVDPKTGTKHSQEHKKKISEQVILSKSPLITLQNITTGEIITNTRYVWQREFKLTNYNISTLVNQTREIQSGWKFIKSIKPKKEK
jgi:hypothetical protein